MAGWGEGVKPERNGPCWCGSGGKAKRCHGTTRHYPAVDFIDGPPNYYAVEHPNVWLALCDDTTLSADFGGLQKGTKVWNAVLVRPDRKRFLIGRARQLIAKYRERWDVEELHWVDIMNSIALRERIDSFDEVVQLAESLAEILKASDSVILSASAEPGRTYPSLPLATGDSVDDMSFIHLMLWLDHWIACFRMTPTDRVLVVADRRGGRMSRSVAADVSGLSLFRNFAGQKIFFGAETWPEFDLADFAAFSYHRAMLGLSRGASGAAYSRLYETFCDVAALRLSPKMRISEVQLNRVQYGGLSLSDLRVSNDLDLGSALGFLK